MTEVLGYSRFAAQGGDWGGQITSRLGYAFADRVIGIHLDLLVRRDPAQSQDPTPEEKIFLNELNHYLKEERGYQWIQGTKPTTLSFGLTDSPARGLDSREVSTLDPESRRNRGRRKPR
jgi:hypothetical protein